MQNPARKRITAEDYAAFMTSLCGMPPGSEREECIRDLTRRLLTMYVEYGIPPTPGLSEFALRMDVTSLRQ